MMNVVNLMIKHPQGLARNDRNGWYKPTSSHPIFLGSALAEPSGWRWRAMMNIFLGGFMFFFFVVVVVVIVVVVVVVVVVLVVVVLLPVVSFIFKQIIWQHNGTIS